MKNMSRIGVALSTMVLASTLAVSNANAAESRSIACRDVSGWGELCFSNDPQGYRATFYKYGNSEDPYDRIDFNMRCANGRWFGDDGAFTIYQGRTASYVYKVGFQGLCWGLVFERDGAHRQAETAGVHPEL
jgi:hypothetical protein